MGEKYVHSFIHKKVYISNNYTRLRWNKRCALVFVSNGFSTELIACLANKIYLIIINEVVGWCFCCCWADVKRGEVKIFIDRHPWSFAVISLPRSFSCLGLGLVVVLFFRPRVWLLGPWALARGRILYAAIISQTHNNCSSKVSRARAGLIIKTRRDRASLKQIAFKTIPYRVKRIANQWNRFFPSFFLHSFTKDSVRGDWF